MSWFHWPLIILSALRFVREIYNPFYKRLVLFICFKTEHDRTTDCSIPVLTFIYRPGIHLRTHFKYTDGVPILSTIRVSATPYLPNLNICNGNALFSMIRGSRAPRRLGTFYLCNYSSVIVVSVNEPAWREHLPHKRRWVSISRAK